MDSITKNTVFFYFLGFLQCRYANSSYRLNEDFHSFPQFFVIFFKVCNAVNLFHVFTDVFHGFTNADYDNLSSARIIEFHGFPDLLLFQQRRLCYFILCSKQYGFLDF